MKTTRRRFAQLAGAAAALPLVSERTYPQTPPPPPQTEKPKPEPPPKEEVKPLAAAMAGVIAAQYGSHLSAEDLREIEKDFNESLSPLERLRKVPLTNSDEPDFTFTVEVKR